MVAAYHAPQYATANGLHTGLTESEARAVMGEPAKVLKSKEWHTLLYSGLSFRVAPGRPLVIGDRIPHQGVYVEVGD